MQPHGGGGGGGGGGHFGDGSTNMQLVLIIGGWQPSDSVLSMIFGGGFLGCSVTLSMIVCGWRVTLTLSMVSPGGVGLRFTSLFMIGGGVGSLIFSTLLFGGDTLQSFPHGGGAGAGHPQDIFACFSFCVVFNLFIKLVFLWFFWKNFTCFYSCLSSIFTNENNSIKLLKYDLSQQIN